jgi:hypothetical protein
MKMTRFVIDESGVVMSYDHWQQIHLPIPSHDPAISTPRKHPAPKSSQPRIVCDLCGVPVLAKRLDKHRKKVHAQQGQILSGPSLSTSKDSIKQPSSLTVQERVYTHCSVCGVTIRVTRVTTHMQKVHRTPVGGPRSSTTTPTKNRQLPNPAQYSTSSNTSTRYYSTTDPMDGGKYLGHIRRDANGQFGSLPLYDDYSEESDAN